mmetsp:Transcript_31442/g.63870  ORF Transcript_31442/g.63870 Transcript_31442/m.63870 type:complete len:472 (-) Transcript_31442:591-2006(-)
MNTRRKRNTTRDSKEAEVRSSLSESLEAIRPQSKRQPTRGTWVTPKGQDGIDVFAALEGLPDSLVDDGADLFASLGGSLGSLGGSLNLSLKLPTPREAPTAVAFPITVDNGGHTGAAAEDDDEGMGQFSTEPWGEEEDAVLREAVLKYGRSDWRGVSRHMLPAHVHRSPLACERRWQVVKENVVKGPWLPEEDQLLRELVAQIGAKKWSVIAAAIPGRAGKQCRERWLNHLDSAVKKSDWSPQEDAMLLESQKRVGNRWSEIAKLLPGRAENAVKNRYNSLITKRIAQRTADRASHMARGLAPPHMAGQLQYRQQQQQAGLSSFDGLPPQQFSAWGGVCGGGCGGLGGRSVSGAAMPPPPPSAAAAASNTAAASSNARALEQQLAGKNVLQQLFTIVAPSVTSPDVPSLTQAHQQQQPFQLGGGGGLRLNFAPPNPPPPPRASEEDRSSSFLQGGGGGAETAAAAAAAAGS